VSFVLETLKNGLIRCGVTCPNPEGLGRVREKRGAP
jgi:hypothetical protein